MRDERDRAMAHGIKRGVSLYSYQEEFYLGQMTLDDCMAATAASGATGVEVLPEQSFDEYPHLTDATVEEWHASLERHGLDPVATDLFLDTKRFRGRLLTLDEGVESVKRDIDLAVRLGAEVIRVIINTPPAVVEAAASYAAEHGIKLGVEIHSPMRYDHRWVQEHLEVIYRVDNGFVGLLPDLGTFVRRFPRVISDRAVRDGGTPALVAHIVRVYDEHPGDIETLAPEVAWRGGNAVDVGLAAAAAHYNDIAPSVLLDFMPYIFHVHAKFYEMTEELEEYSIPYEEIIPVLVEGGYQGYLSSEYEGNRHLQDIGAVDSVEQVRRHQAMLGDLLTACDRSAVALAAGDEGSDRDV
jgi:sugar phosphate isomerase/epimerase